MVGGTRLFFARLIFSLVRRRRSVRSTTPHQEAIPKGETPRRTLAIPLRDHVEGRGVDLFRIVCERDLEGIIAKRKAEGLDLS